MLRGEPSQTSAELLGALAHLADEGKASEGSIPKKLVMLWLLKHGTGTHIYSPHVVEINLRMNIYLLDILDI